MSQQLRKRGAGKTVFGIQTTPLWGGGARTFPVGEKKNRALHFLGEIGMEGLNHHREDGRKRGIPTELGKRSCKTRFTLAE